MHPVLISACLLGVTCRYDQGSRPVPKLIEKLSNRHIIPVCPEQLGGLSTPRPAAHIVGGDGFDVLEGKAGVFVRMDPGIKAGKDVTAQFVKGAEQCAMLARIFDVRHCYLKARSPSCGLSPITGVTAARLIMLGLEVIEAG